jgi:hypothetical protein
MHCPELVDVEVPQMRSIALLPEEDWAGGIKEDQYGYD